MNEIMNIPTVVVVLSICADAKVGFHNSLYEIINFPAPSVVGVILTCSLIASNSCLQGPENCAE